MKETRNEREAERDRGIFKCLTPLPNHSLTHTAVTLLSLSLSVTTVHIIYPPLPFTISAKPKWLSSSLHFSILSLSLSINLSFPNPHFILPSISQTNLPSILFNQQATTCVCRLGSIQDLWGTSSGPSRYIYLEISKMHDRSLTKKKKCFCFRFFIVLCLLGPGFIPLNFCFHLTSYLFHSPSISRWGDILLIYSSLISSINNISFFFP